MSRPRNWVFLGDSLTEGIGSSRASYVTELARLLRQAPAPLTVHDIRLREVDPATFNPYLRTNLAGFLDLDPHPSSAPLWLWNLASEGRTIETDVGWLPLLQNLQPERIFIYRGSLESILRPAAVRDGQWPVWVPASWQGFVAMDPRCYFSNTWWRRAKQVNIDRWKQVARRRLLRDRPPLPLVDGGRMLAEYSALLTALRPLGAQVWVLGLVPPDPDCFPGTPEHFRHLNESLHQLASASGAEFVDWASGIAASGLRSWRYRDGFHPNLSGARLMADLLRTRLSNEGRA